MPQNPNIPLNNDRFSRFHDKATRDEQLRSFYPEDIESCTLRLQATLKPHQISWYQVSRELFSPGNRAMGRTYAIMVAIVTLALENPNQQVFVIDHYPQNLANSYAVRSELERIIHMLPEAVSRQFRLIGQGNRLAVEFRTK